MKKSTYNTLSKIPIVGTIAQIICSPILFSSQGIADGTYDYLRDFAKKHPDILITDKLAKDIKKGKQI